MVYYGMIITHCENLSLTPRLLWRKLTTVLSELRMSNRRKMRLAWQGCSGHPRSRITMPRFVGRSVLIHQLGKSSKFPYCHSHSASTAFAEAVVAWERVSSLWVECRNWLTSVFWFIADKVWRSRSVSSFRNCGDQRDIIPALETLSSNSTTCEL